MNGKDDDRSLHGGWGGKVDKDEAWAHITHVILDAKSR